MRLALPSNASISKNTNSLSNLVSDVESLTLAPILLLLCLIQVGVVVRLYKSHHDNPFCDLRTMDTRGGAEWDVGVRVDWMLCDMVGPEKSGYT